MMQDREGEIRLHGSENFNATTLLGLHLSSLSIVIGTEYLFEQSIPQSVSRNNRHLGPSH